jgi:hypothetical protein
MMIIMNNFAPLLMPQNSHKGESATVGWGKPHPTPTAAQSKSHATKQKVDAKK